MPRGFFGMTAGFAVRGFRDSRLTRRWLFDGILGGGEGKGSVRKF